MDKDTADIARADGAHNQRQARVLIYLEDEVPQEYLEHVFLHELFHAMFETSGHPNLSEDEGLVDSMAALLHQYLQTNKGEL
jgi:hypothetical protein